ncbi:MAG TPA: glycosyltransferase [Nitrospira sp.]|nr:glycosyltransferase [Nitrospira sp.]HQR13026.1 glycosyltransferase [Nitrospira sp.]HQV11590.1 glycosyltransferase [Nitrospira sp.]
MRIAQVSQCVEEVSSQSERPDTRSVEFLTRSLIRFGHEVTVFASGDSRVSGTLVPVAPQALRHYPSPKRHLAEGLTLLAVEKAFSMGSSFDLLHVHAGFTAFPLMRRSPLPTVATVYGSLHAPEVLRLFREFKELPLVATSAEQIRQCPDLKWLALIPVPAPYQPSDGHAQTLDSLVETATAYTAVYEGILERAARQVQAVRRVYSVQGVQTVR